MRWRPAQRIRYPHTIRNNQLSHSTCVRAQKRRQNHVFQGGSDSVHIKVKVYGYKRPSCIGNLVGGSEVSKITQHNREGVGECNSTLAEILWSVELITETWTIPNSRRHFKGCQTPMLRLDLSEHGCEVFGKSTGESCHTSV